MLVESNPSAAIYNPDFARSDIQTVTKEEPEEQVESLRRQQEQDRKLHAKSITWLIEMR